MDEKSMQINWDQSIDSLPVYQQIIVQADIYMK